MQSLALWPPEMSLRSLITFVCLPSCTLKIVICPSSVATVECEIPMTIMRQLVAEIGTRKKGNVYEANMDEQFGVQ